MWARILREAGARVRENFFVRDAPILSIAPTDQRKIEVVATNLPYGRGVPVAVDATLISPLHADGSAWAGASTRPGANFQLAFRSNTTTHPELVDNSALRLVTIAPGVGGRLNSSAHHLLDAAASLRAQLELKLLQS